MLVGIALSESKIKVDRRSRGQYVPGLKGHPYGETPIRHLLTMSSGVKFVEAYNGQRRHHEARPRRCLHQGPGGPQALEPFRERVAPPGKQFSYASSETYVLALVLRAATGRQRCRVPLREDLAADGAEADAAWNIDADGLRARLLLPQRDAARLGTLRAASRRGRARDGKQIIPAAWIKEATGNRAPMTGYGYQTWVSRRKDRFQPARAARAGDRRSSRLENGRRAHRRVRRDGPAARGNIPSSTQS
jgi:CubicO group peptidase (beta-lactamase class C family)